MYDYEEIRNTEAFLSYTVYDTLLEPPTIWETVRARYYARNPSRESSREPTVHELYTHAYVYTLVTYTYVEALLRSE